MSGATFVQQKEVFDPLDFSSARNEWLEDTAAGSYLPKGLSCAAQEARNQTCMSLYVLTNYTKSLLKRL